MRIGESAGAEQARQKVADGRPAGKTDFSMVLRKAEEQAGSADGASSPPVAETVERAPVAVAEERTHTDFRRRFWEIIKGGTAKQDAPAASAPQEAPTMPLHRVEEQLAGVAADPPARALPPDSARRDGGASRPLSNKSGQKYDMDSEVPRPESTKETPAAPPASAGEGEAGERIFLGVVDRRNPSISHLLAGNPMYQKEVWEIIHAGVNQGKPYRRIPTGAPVYLDPGTRELVWDGMEVLPARPGGTTDPVHLARPAAEAPAAEDRAMPEVSAGPERSAGMELAGAVLPGSGEAPERVSIGSLSRGAPSVAHLLRNHPQYREDTWRILKNPANQGKPFSSMRVGTEVFLDPESDELFWGKGAAGITGRNALPDGSAVLSPSSPAETVREGGAADAAGRPARDLAASVEPYFGRSYGEFDCYGLVVQGLKEMGVDYSGPEGLKNNLVKLAIERGLPANAYLNGEGLIEVSGEKLFSKSVPRVQQPEQEADEAFREMEPLLGRGCILSFSTPTRGHTGIVSQRDNAWTFINSGRMDHDVADRNGRKRVGEEDLRAEVGNWFKLARERGESLLVTLGRLEEDKLRTASREDGVGPDRVLL